jgi:glycosyltransferase involved in cell wall biosynthesis
MKVIHLVNEITSTSNSVTIAQKVNRHTPANVLLVSFYDSRKEYKESDREVPMELECLNGRNRFDVRAYSRLRQLVSDGTDILHTHHNSVGSFARIAVIGTGVSIVNTEHRSHDAFTPLQLATNTISYPCIDGMVANSDQTLDSFRWFEKIMLGKKSKIRRVYNGIDTEWIRDTTHKAPSDLPDGPLVTNVSRMIDLKNQRRLISAFNSVLEQNDEVTLVIVGDGPLMNELHELAASYEITEHIHFTGQISRESVYAILQQSTVFTIPSLSEGFCVAAVEAMASGLPIIASDIDILREVVGDCGVFVDPQDTTALANEISGLLSDAELRSALGNAAADRANNQFPISQIASEYYSLYSDIVSGNRKEF